MRIAFLVMAGLLGAGLLTGCGKAPILPVGPDAKAAAQQDGVAVALGRSFEIDSEVMGGVRRINVYAPPDYEAKDGEPAKALPVLYVIDGGVEQDFPHIAALSQYAWVSGSFRDFIVVGIETVDRRRELTARAVNDEALAKEYPTHGEAAKFREFITGEVKPWVERRFRTDGHDAVIGESLAGLFVVETFLRQPALFDGYIAVDPSLWWDRQALSEEAAGLAAAHSGGDRTFFMAVANEGAEMRAGQDRVAKAVQASPPPDLKIVYRKMEDEGHGTIYHRAALEGLRLVFANPPEAK